MAAYRDLPTPPAEATEEHAKIWLTKTPATSGTPVDEAEVIALGGNDKWLYYPSSGLFDLSRGSERTLTLQASPGDALLHHHNGILIDPSKTCLVIVDMQNYFIHPDFHQHAAGLAAVEPISRAIQKCRAESIQVAWLNWVIDEQDLLHMPPAVQRCFDTQRAQTCGNGWGVKLGSHVPERLGGSRVLWRGSWNADVYLPLKELMSPTDMVCHKNRMSGMWHTTEQLRRVLCAGAFQTLLFAGINTDMCLLSTMTDAYSSGFDVIMLRDCTGTATQVQGAQQLVENNVATCMGFVFDSKAFVGAEWRGRRPDFMRCDSGIDLV